MPAALGARPANDPVPAPRIAAPPQRSRIAAPGQRPRSSRTLSRRMITAGATSAVTTAVARGVVAWLALGRRDPLATVYEHRDEREAVAG